MRKIVIILLLLLTTQLSLSQNVLINNVNDRAKFLKHYLSEDTRTLHLESQFEITSLKMICGDSTFVIDCGDKKVFNQPLTDITSGRNVVMVFSNDMIVVFNIIGDELEPLIENNNDITIRPYDISSKDRNNMQSRDEYRKTHLRPNGKPYN